MNNDEVPRTPTPKPEKTMPKEIKRRYDNDYLKPQTVEWLARQLQENKPEMAIAQLRIWTHPHRREEASYETIAEINQLMDTLAKEALEEMQKPRQYIHTTRLTNQLELPVVLESLGSGYKYGVKALIDSGCMGSCINQTFVEENGLVTQKTA